MIQSDRRGKSAAAEGKARITPVDTTQVQITLADGSLRALQEVYEHRPDSLGQMPAMNSSKRGGASLINDAALTQVIASLTTEQRQAIQSFSVPACSITDASAASISLLPNIRHLEIGYNHITDETIRGLTGLRHLEFLDIAQTDVTDGVFAILKVFPKLRLMDLRAPGLSVEAKFDFWEWGVAERGFENFRVVFFPPQCPIGDGAFEAFQAFLERSGKAERLRHIIQEAQRRA